MPRKTTPPQPAARPPDESLISPNEAAQWLGVKPEVLAQWRYRGIGPAFVRFNERSVRYRPTVIREWVASRETTG